MLALGGTKILDLSGGYPGAFSTWILSDLGADVINVEGRPGAKERQTKSAGEAKRRIAAYQTLHRNKKSIVLDLKSEDGRQVFYRLAETADVIMEPFRPGVAKRLGIDYQTISRKNPRIVYCSLTGYGQDGPYSSLPGHDINYISMGGALSLIGTRDGQPIIPLNFIGDLAGGALYATVGILTALIARNRTGKGQYIDMAYTDGVVSMLTPLATRYFRDNMIPKRGEGNLSGSYPYYAVFQTKDGKFISLGCIEPRLWENFCLAINRPDLVPFHGDHAHRTHKPEGEKWQEISSFLKELFLTRSRDDWFDFLSQKDVAVANVYSIDEVFTDPQVLHRKMVVEVEHLTEGKVKQVGIAIKLSDTPGEIRSLPPVIGEHTDELLTGVGYSPEQIKELRVKGVIA